MFNKTTAAPLLISNFDSMESLEGKSVSFVNPYSYLALKKHGFSVNSIDIWFSDGFLLCWIMSCFNFNVKRFSFDYSSIADIVFSWCKSHEKSVSLVGADQESVTYFAEQLNSRFEITPLSYRNGFFNELEYRDYLKKLRYENPDIIIVGMGTPKQEQFLLDLRSIGWNGIGFTCGGFIHQTKKNEGIYYPSLINKFNLRFLYRMWREPNTIKRYFINYPISLLSIANDLFSGKLLGQK